MYFMKIFAKRRLYIYGKVLLVIVASIIYVAFLLRESYSAIELSKDKFPRLFQQKIAPHPLANRQSSWPVLKKLRAPVAAANMNPGATLNGGTTLNPIYEYSEEQNAAVEKCLAMRKEQLWDTCVKQDIVGKYPPNAGEFFISPGHGLTWCNIFKAASSTWMYYFNILGGYNSVYLQRTKSPPLELARKRFPRPKLNELYDELSNSISFLIVREPFERLLSAFRNKLEGSRNKYYRLLGEQIVKQFRTKPTKYPSGPTFKEFLQFLINEHKHGKRFDEHWSPIHTFCTPCTINFTLIAKVETFQRDTEYIIRHAGLETLLLNKLPPRKLKLISNRATHKTKNLIPKYFSKIDDELLRKLIDIYYLDFELFDYNSTKYFDYIQLTAKLTPGPTNFDGNVTIASSRPQLLRNAGKRLNI